MSPTSTSSVRSTRSAASTLALGIDIGATKTEMVLLDAQGQCLLQHRHPTPVDPTGRQALEQIIRCVGECLAGVRGRISGVGIGVAGQVDPETGAVLFAPNLGWNNLPLRQQLEEALGLPVSVTNDVKAAARGEWRLGAGRGVEDLVMITVGTGIGCAVVSGGRLLEGPGGTVGEFGHATLVAGGRRCSCRNLGCLEAYVGGWALGQRARESVRLSVGEPSRMLALAGGVEQISARTVAQAWEEGDPVAGRLVHDAGRELGAGLVSLVNGLNPARLIVGGGVIDGLPGLVDAAKAYLWSHALPAALDGLEVVPPTLGSGAGSIGAATMVWQQSPRRSGLPVEREAPCAS